MITFSILLLLVHFCICRSQGDKIDLISEIVDNPIFSSKEIPSFSSSNFSSSSANVTDFLDSGIQHVDDENVPKRKPRYTLFNPEFENSHTSEIQRRWSTEPLRKSDKKKRSNISRGKRFFDFPGMDVVETIGEILKGTAQISNKRREESYYSPYEYSDSSKNEGKKKKLGQFAELLQALLAELDIYVDILKNFDKY